MFLAIYHLQALACPDKVLTHRDDIVAELGRAGFALGCCEAMQSTGAAIEDDDQLLRNTLSSLPQFPPHRQLVRLTGSPAWMDIADQVVEAEHACVGDSNWALVAGAGQLMFVSGQTLRALECSAGDTLSLPAATGHWFRPAPGERCVVLHSAWSPQALRRESTGSDLAERFPGLGG